MEYVVVYLQRDEQSKADYRCQVNETRRAALVSYDGDVKSATEHYTRMLLHHGDPDGTPEEYGVYEESPDDVIQVLVFPLVAATVGCIGDARTLHNLAAQG